MHKQTKTAESDARHVMGYIAVSGSMWSILGGAWKSRLDAL